MPAHALPARITARLARLGGGTGACLAAAGALAAAAISSPADAAGRPAPPAAPASIAGAEFRAVTALSAADAWAVGDSGSTTGLLKTLVAHWDGTRWARVASPSPGVQTAGSTLAGVSAASPADVWAVGDYETSAGVTRTLVVHWNGSSWLRVASPSPGTGFLGNALSGVSARSPSDAWAVGNATIGGVGRDLVLHWDGTRWARVPSPSPGGAQGSGLAAVSAASPADAWAVGCYGFNTGTGASSTLALHWDGTRWAQVLTPTPGAARSACLAGVSVLSASDAWAVGYFVPSATSGAQQPLVLHWDGTRWAQVATPAPGDTLVTELNGVAAISAADAWAVGDVFNGTRQTRRTLVFHWNGIRWARVASPSPGFAGLFGVSASSAADAWAVGLGRGSLILHWNGTRWTQS